MLVGLMVALVACSGGAATDQATPPVDGATTAAPAADGAAAPAADGAATPPADAAAAPAAGAVTKAQLDEAAAGVQPMQPWGVAETSLKGKLGEPKVNDAMMATWVANDGGKCFTLTVTKMMDSTGGAAVTETPCP